jgi:two-component system, LytTR family, response regulator
MENLKVVIVDDEEKAVEILSTILLNYCSNIEICETANSAEAGLKIINKHKPDIAFLDISMTDATGFDVANGINNSKTLIVFVTAHEKFAIKAFKFNTFDYLLKPTGIEEIQDVITRAKIWLDENRKSESLPNEIKNQKLIINSLNETTILDPKEIVYIEADGRYSTIFLSNGNKFCVTKSLSVLEESLDERLFFRTHHSILLNLSFVNSVSSKEGHIVNLNNGQCKVPLSRRRKDEFFERIKN